MCDQKTDLGLRYVNVKLTVVDFHAGFDVFLPHAAIYSNDEDKEEEVQEKEGEGGRGRKVHGQALASRLCYFDKVRSTHTCNDRKQTLKLDHV